MKLNSRALRAAHLLDRVDLLPSACKIESKAADELRRLHFLNTELVEALQMVMDNASCARRAPLLYIIDDDTLNAVCQAVAKAREDKK